MRARFPTPASPRLRDAALRLAFELLVVFMGVSAAFFVDSYRERQQSEARSRQVYLALDRELGRYVEFAPVLAGLMTARLDAWAAARRAGERPPPAYYHEPSGERIPATVWDATLASGGVNVVDPTLFYALAEHYNRLNSISDRYARYNEFTERELLPRERTPAAFYDARTGELLPAYAAHMDRLRDIRAALLASVADGRRLRAQIAQGLRRGGS